MILSASRRTDLPHYYAKWLMQRLQAGYALVRSPFNHAQLQKILLSPDIVDCIVFWSKDPSPLFPYLKLLDQMGYRYYFQFTLTPYGKDIEPGLREKCEIETDFLRLSELVGKHRVIWRYDPILLWRHYDLHFHLSQFERLCQKLKQYTETVIVSLVDPYAKLKTAFPAPAGPMLASLVDGISSIAGAAGLSLRACCEAHTLADFGIASASCIDRSLIERLCGAPLNMKPDKNQRPGCGCFESIDLGTYNTCPAGCRYCYANRSPASALQNYRIHCCDSPLLLGTPSPEETAVLRKGCVSLQELQKSLF